MRDHPKKAASVAQTGTRFKGTQPKVGDHVYLFSGQADYGGRYPNSMYEGLLLSLTEKEAEVAHIGFVQEDDDLESDKVAKWRIVPMDWIAFHTHISKQPPIVKIGTRVIAKIQLKNEPQSFWLGTFGGYDKASTSAMNERNSIPLTQLFGYFISDVESAATLKDGTARAERVCMINVWVYEDAFPPRPNYISLDQLNDWHLPQIKRSSANRAKQGKPVTISGPLSTSPLPSPLAPLLLPGPPSFPNRATLSAKEPKILSDTHPSFGAATVPRISVLPKVEQKPKASPSPSPMSSSPMPMPISSAPTPTPSPTPSFSYSPVVLLSNPSPTPPTFPSLSPSPPPVKQASSVLAPIKIDIKPPAPSLIAPETPKKLKTISPFAEVPPPRAESRQIGEKNIEIIQEEEAEVFPAVLKSPAVDGPPAKRSRLSLDTYTDGPLSIFSPNDYGFPQAPLPSDTISNIGQLREFQIDCTPLFDYFSTEEDDFDELQLMSEGFIASTCAQ